MTAQLFAGRLFEYGAGKIATFRSEHRKGIFFLIIGVGDQTLPPGLDAGKKMQLSHGVSFYGREYSTLYILSNGGIGFDTGAKNYRSGILPGNLKLLAPFWNRNDLRNGGNVHYREVQSGRALDRGQSEIRYQYDREVKVQSAIIVTWEKMQPLGSEALPDEVFGD